MSIVEAILLTAEILLTLVSFLTLVDYLRHRSRPRLDIALMFATLGVPTLFFLIQDLLNYDSTIQDTVVFILIFAHPYMMLRLVRHFEPLPAWIFRTALAGFIFSALLIAGVFFAAGDFQQVSPGVLVMAVFAVLYFVTVEGYTAFKFIRGALRTSGLTHHRLRYLGVGSVFLAAIFVTLILSIGLRSAGIDYPRSLLSFINGIFAILIGLTYLLGLSPPRFLLSYWQLSELQKFLDKMNRVPADQPTSQLLDLLSRSAVRATGGAAGTVAFWQPETKDFILQPPPDYEALSGLHIPDGGQIGRAWHEQKAVIVQGASGFGPGDLQAAAQVNAAAIAIVPIQVIDQPYGLLLIFLPYDPLFPGDDLELLNLFVNRVSLALASIRLLEHERQLVKELTENTAALQDARDTLEQRVQERTAELAAVNEELKQFTYIVSHDLRSPLVNLKGFVTELGFGLKELKALQPQFESHLSQDDQRRLQAALDEDMPEAMDFISTAALHMDGLVQALLNLSRVGYRRLNFEAVDMNELVADILKTLSHVIDEKGVQVDVDPLPDTIADRLSMEQIISNLLTNAVNYLDPDRPGRIRISATAETDTFTYYIADNGRGISESNRTKVFAPFRRGAHVDVAGEGMGLATVQTLVRRHNGTITFDSEPGAGTTFHLTLPKKRTATSLVAHEFHE